MASVIFLISASNSFNDGGDAHATTYAQGGQAVTQLALLKLVDQGAENGAAGCTQRVPHGNGAAIDVDLVLADAHVLHKFHHHRGKRLVDLKQVDVIDVQPGLGQCLARGRRRAGEHDGRVGTGHGGSNDARARLQTQLLALGLGTDQHQGRTVNDAGAVARGVYVVDL